MSSKSNPRVKKVSKRIKHMITFLDEMETMFFDIDKFYDGFRDNANQNGEGIDETCTLHELYPHWNGPKLIPLDKIKKMNKNYMDFIKKYEKNLSFLELSDGLLGLIEEEKDKWDMVEYEPELLWKNCLVGNTYQESLLFDIHIAHDLLVRINNKLELIEKTKNAKKRLSVSKALQSRLGKDSPLKNIIETGLYENFTKGSMRKRTKRKKHKGRNGIDFKIFNIDPNKPSTCRPRIEKVSKCKSHRMKLPRRSKCKSHRMRLPRRSKCKSHRGKFMINPMLKHMKIPKKKKCNESIVHFLNL